MTQHLVLSQGLDRLVGGLLVCLGFAVLWPSEARGFSVSSRTVVSWSEWRSGSSQVPARWLGVDAADVDDDGDLDLVIVNADSSLSWLENTDDNGTFSQTFRPIGPSPGHVSVVSTDLDGDGDDDLVTCGSTLRWLENEGGIFTAQQIDGRPHRAAVPVDFEGDGDLDLVGAGANGVPPSIFLNGGEADPTFSVRQVLPHEVQFAMAVDLDRDGDMDLLTAGDALLWLENGGPASPEFAVHTVEPQSVSSVAALDMDDDGDLDLLSNTLGDVCWHENQGGDPFAWKLRRIASLGYVKSVAAVDLDADGDPEPIISTPSVSWLERSADPPYVWTMRLITGNSRVEYATGDLDGDGFVDFAIESYVVTHRYGPGIPIPIDTLTTETIYWNRNGFGLTLDTPVLLDASGDDVFSPGEPGQVRMRLTNPALFTQTGVSVSAESHSPDLTFAQPLATVGDLLSSEFVDLTFDFMTSPTATLGSRAAFDVVFGSSRGDAGQAGPSVLFGLFTQMSSTASESPGLDIPDNSPAGITRTLTIDAGGGTITGVTVSYNISHPFRGDLLVTLQHPSGETLTLYDAPGESGADLIQTKDLYWQWDNLPASGDYQLTVADRAAGDAGVLNGWLLTVDWEGYVATAWREEEILDRLLGAPPTLLVLDLNGDGSVDAADLVHLLNHRRASPTGP